MLSGTAPLPKVSPVAKKKPAADGPEKKKLYSVRFGPADSARVESTAATLGLDEANFLRMMILETLPRYEKKAALIRDGHSPD